MVNALVNKIKSLSDTDQIIFARLYRDEIKSIISGDTSKISELQQALKEWEEISE